MRAFNLMEVMLAQILTIFVFGLTLLYCRFFWIHYHQQNQENRFIKDQLLFENWVTSCLKRSTQVQFNETSITFIYPQGSKDALDLDPELVLAGQPFFDEPLKVSVRKDPTHFYLKLSREAPKGDSELQFPLPNPNWQSKAWYAEY